VTSLGTIFYRSLVASALVVFLINGVPKDTLHVVTMISGVGNGLSNYATWFDAVSSPRTMPEPASLLLMGSCLAGISAMMRRRAKKA
jgi:hypothetical protein